MRASRWAAVVLGALAAPGVARADVAVPGFKFVELRVSIDNLADYPDHAFFLVVSGWLLPGERVSGPGRPEAPPRVSPGELVRPGYPARWNHTWMLVAVPRQRVEQAGKATWEMLAEGAPGVLYSNRVELAQPDSVVVFSPRDYEFRHFRVALGDGQLTLTPGAVERGSDGFGSWVPGLITAAVVVLLGFWIVRRVRRHRRGAAGEKA